MIPILIVDDSREDATLAMRVLKQCKILNPLTILTSGAECISYFQSGTPPCLVLLDLTMTPISGIEVLRSLHSRPAAKGSIFVMLSGLQNFRVLWEGYQLGAATFLVKPLRMEDVLQMISAIRGIQVEKTPEGYIISTATALPSPASRGVIGSNEARYYSA